MVTKPTGRPRGRPKGSKNIPKLDQLVAESLSTRIIPPKPIEKPKKSAGVWSKMTPEERSEYARKIRPKGTTNPKGRPAGLPKGFTVETFKTFQREQEELVNKVVKKMIKEGEIPADEAAQAAEALTTTGVVLRTSNDNKVKIAAARLILDFTKAKPSQRIEHTVKTAEELLDELGDD